jgi:four helix bundle protein
MSEGKPYDLEERLIEFAVRILRLPEALPNTPTGNHIRGQIIRSGTSQAPNYAEARSAESRNDFVHKIQIVLKELRETLVWLRIIMRAELIKPASLVAPVAGENNELISIFVTSSRTASAKAPRRPGKGTLGCQPGGAV